MLITFTFHIAIMSNIIDFTGLKYFFCGIELIHYQLILPSSLKKIK